MSWTTRELEKRVLEAKSSITKEFNILIPKIDCPIFITQSDELHQAILDELNQLNYSKDAIMKLEGFILPFVVGKYFKFKHQIWLLNGKESDIDIIIHELLHSIQLCEPNREGIVNYLTYKITRNLEYINPNLLSDWQEIEEMVSYNKIQEQLLHKGDCEDF